MDDDRIISSYNLWIDTIAHERQQERGDYFTLTLGSQPIIADSGQYIRLTLNNFHMPKVWNTINETCNKVNLRLPNPPPGGSYPPQYHQDFGGGGPAPDGLNPANIPTQNYRTIYFMGLEFGDAVALEMTNWFAGAVVFTSVLINPEVGSTAPGNTNNIIQFRISATGLIPAAEIWNTIEVQMFSEDSESYIILGGNRLNGRAGENPARTGSSWSVVDESVVAGQGPWLFTGLYPALRTSQPYVYLRSKLSNFGVETATYADPPNPQPPSSDTNTTAILAKIPVDTEAATYDSNYGREYFLNIYNRHISNIFLYVTDERNRALARSPTSDNPLTATGTGREQSTLGNLYFSAVIRVDIIQQTLPRERLFEPVPNPLNPKSAQLLINPSAPPDDNPELALRGLNIAQAAAIRPVIKGGGILARGRGGERGY